MVACRGLRALSDITVLHCNTEYPTSYSDSNISAMLHIGKYFGVSYGLSDHSLGIEVPIAAVALGAKVIEKHYVFEGDETVDSFFSLNTKQFKNIHKTNKIHKQTKNSF